VKVVVLMSCVFLERSGLSYKARESGEHAGVRGNEKMGGEPNTQQPKPNNPRIQNPLAKYFIFCNCLLFFLM
jgi:hypothetical protein